MTCDTTRDTRTAAITTAMHDVQHDVIMSDDLFVSRRRRFSLIPPLQSHLMLSLTAHAPTCVHEQCGDHCQLEPCCHLRLIMSGWPCGHQCSMSVTMRLALITTVRDAKPQLRTGGRVYNPSLVAWSVSTSDGSCNDSPCKDAGVRRNLTRRKSL